ncbi:uncharacterized protein LOC143545014 [Bidens hawaiensis]|uniref:uncharacterized protein LOC143545014 n=1 Tax=Bidens hawaiensis TaxID=980011 RepID=UPI0040494C90
MKKGVIVYFHDNDQLDDVAQRPTAAMSKFTEWMRANQDYPEVCVLTYTEFPTNLHGMKVKKHGSYKEGDLVLIESILCALLWVKDIRTVDGVEYPNYMLACKAFGLLVDDVEWVASIREASQWKLWNKFRELHLNRLIADESTYNMEEEITIFYNLHHGLNPQQMEVFDYMLHSVDSGTSGVVFVFGSGGTGKKYLWKTLISCICACGQIVLSVASSGIASLLLPSGRIAHSLFKLPFDLEKDSTCLIDFGSELAELLMRLHLTYGIRHHYNTGTHLKLLTALFKTFVNITYMMRTVEFLGGNVVLGGDFCQILPVILHAPRSEIVASVINKSSTI